VQGPRRAALRECLGDCPHEDCGDHEDDGHDDDDDDDDDDDGDADHFTL